ncbi:3-oxoacyl-reductase [Hymenopellis radicata]|nr:3-oxoacyl-reductase [Hymenopellis radicata]
MFASRLGSIRSSSLQFSRTFASSAITRRTAIVTVQVKECKAIALRLAHDGFDVCVNDLPNNGAIVDEVVKEIKAKGRNAISALGDVSKQADVLSLVQASVDELGPLNVMVANAGIARVKSMLELTEADIKEMFETNIYGVFHCDSIAAKQGKIINAASIVAYKPFPLLSHYSATKAAVRSFTQAFAMELAPHKITVNGYAPGVVGSKMWETIDEGMGKINGLPRGENFKRMVDNILLGRTSVPEDVSKTVSYLAGPDSDYVTGQTLLVDGGMIFG